MMPRVLEGQGLSFGFPRLSFSNTLFLLCQSFCSLDSSDSSYKEESLICTVKLVSFDFMANLGFVVSGSGVKVRKSIRAQLTLDSTNNIN